MKEYSIITDKQSGIETLHADGKQCICPFQNKLLIPGDLQGTLMMQQFNCTSACMMFDFYPVEKYVDLRCINSQIKVEKKEASTIMLPGAKNGMA